MLSSSDAFNVLIRTLHWLLATMGFFNSLCETLTGALGLSTVSQWGATPPQQPLALDVVRNVRSPSGGHVPSLKAPKRDNDVIYSEDYVYSNRHHGAPAGPIFHPPNASPNFKCNYSAMRGWKHSASSGSRTQWLSHAADSDFPYGGTYDIDTDYNKFAPTGITRKVSY